MPLSLLSPGPRWYCAWTHHGGETRAELGLMARGFEVCLPLVRARRVEHVGPLFPGYLFVRFDPGKDQWRRIYRTSGIAGLIGAAVDRPTPVPEGVVEDLARRMAPNRIVDDQGHAAIGAGDQATVLEGPWAGWAGICTLSSRERVRLLLSVFGREAEVDFPRYAVVAA